MSNSAARPLGGIKPSHDIDMIIALRRCNISRPIYNASTTSMYGIPSEEYIDITALIYVILVKFAMHTLVQLN